MNQYDRKPASSTSAARAQPGAYDPVRPNQKPVASGPITTAYEKETDHVVGIQLERAGVRLAYLLNDALRPI